MDDAEALAKGWFQIAYRGPHDDRFLYRALFESRVPLQPRWEPPSTGARVREAAKNGASHLTMRFFEQRAKVLSHIERGLRSRI